MDNVLGLLLRFDIAGHEFIRTSITVKEKKLTLPIRTFITNRGKSNSY